MCYSLYSNVQVQMLRIIPCLGLVYNHTDTRLTHGCQPQVVRTCKTANELIDYLRPLVCHIYSKEHCSNLDILVESPETLAQQMAHSCNIHELLFQCCELILCDLYAICDMIQKKPCSKSQD